MNSVVHGSPPADAFDDLIRQVELLRSSIVQKAERKKECLQGLSAERYRSAENLLHYVALRSRDIRPLQDRLARLGLSSLGRSEAHVLASIDAVLYNLYLLCGKEPSDPDSQGVFSNFDVLADQLELNTIALLGEHPRKRRGHIVVTISPEAADNYLMVHQLVKSGMNCMRVNCVHDGPEVWSRMIGHVRDAEQATGLPCRVLMDLGGPKLRLGPMEPIPAVLKIRPRRSKDGHVVRPARIWLAARGEALTEMPTADTTIALDPDWISVLKTGDRVRFRDNRGSKRSWRIREVDTNGCWAEAKKTAYIANGTDLKLQRGNGETGLQTTIEGLAPQDSVSNIRSGDILYLFLGDDPGKPACHDSNGELLTPARIPLPIPEVFSDIRLGEPVSFDDGRISGLIEKCDAEQLQVRITHTRKPVEKLEGRRGLNLAETNLHMPVLGEKDRRDLEFISQNSDMVGLSFTNSPEDVRALHEVLRESGREDIGVVLKIETRKGLANLPAILLEALKFPACGIMIARGDLAVECGFERMSEAQEEILWFCEAAHVPVIWATQVLEGLTKFGHVTRAEITDAAMSQTAEAVMLNKGPHINEAVEMLDDILQRMQEHRRKKRSILRELQIASEFVL